MTTAARAVAEHEQRCASDPAVSAFVSASAGSGKTKLLTDRLLRLMLAGAEPGRIQCLTFTKAGAAEMAVRLHQTLGRWVVAPDEELDPDLAALTLVPDPTLRRAARRLFAQVLDLPGGMRIGTIHAFCQSLLRRFPLEAALSPHFELLDDMAARSLQQAARDEALAAADEAAIAMLAPQVTLDLFASLVNALGDRQERLDAALAAGPEALFAAQRRALGLAPHEDEDSILREAIAAIDLPVFRAAMRKVQEGVNSNLEHKVPAALQWLADAPPKTGSEWHRWAGYFLRQDFEPCHHAYLVSAPLEKKYPGLRALLLEEQERVCAVLNRIRADQLARLSAALVRLALPALQDYAARKAAAGRLDYADLISGAARLLHEPGAAWVLYKLDGGLDHLLLDEVQDTAPDQWRIVDQLTAEFFAGQGARAADPPRSVFAVGDHKQSIFSFQGAAPEVFPGWRDQLGQRVRDAGAAFRAVSLKVSFRSTSPVLALVDAVFADPRTAMGLTGEDAVTHIADRADQAGRVEIWPLAPRPQPPEVQPWEPPDTAREPPRAPQVLADTLAQWIARQTDGSVQLQSRGRPLHPGDILVLVRSRGSFDRALLRALKAQGVPVAGLDRMVLTEQVAVADLLALCAVLLLPSDDLTLATVLTSPLGNLTDHSLMELALGRGSSTLWQTLGRRAGERTDWSEADRFLRRLFALADYVTPHALLCEALGPLGGRARLFARLGPQAAEAVDELLSQALIYAQRAPPSLQGFLHWLRESGSEVKREAEGAVREVRIMTVHGAKGLQAPMVILPATTGLSKHRSSLVWVADPAGGPAVPLWGPRKDTHEAVMRQSLQVALDAERQEHYRLLYVALTRAEDRLLVCGWEPHQARPDCWYDVIHDAFARLPDRQSTPFGAWAGEALSHASAQRGPVRTDRAPPRSDPETLPVWAGADTGWVPLAPPPEPALPTPLAPSRPEQAALGAVPHAASPLALRDATGRRFRRGQLLHALLQHLPNVEAAQRPAVATAYLRRQLAPEETRAAVAEALALIDDPALAPLFGAGSRAEVPLTGVIETPQGPMVVGGLVDRLVVRPDEILIADYKTNRDPPGTIAQTPALYVNQMASYRAVLRAIFPDRPVRCVLIWTRTGRADWLPDGLLDPALNPVPAPVPVGGRLDPPTAQAMSDLQNAEAEP